MNGNGSTRTPTEMMTTAYGAPAEWPQTPQTPAVPFIFPFVPPQPLATFTPEEWADLLLKLKTLAQPEATTRRLRVAARKTDAGIAVKVYLEDKLLCETTVDGLAASIDLDI